MRLKIKEHMTRPKKHGLGVAKEPRSWCRRKAICGSLNVNGIHPRFLGYGKRHLLLLPPSVIDAICWGL